jgi:hypothetical protein
MKLEDLPKLTQLDRIEIEEDAKESGILRKVRYFLKIDTSYSPPRLYYSSILQSLKDLHNHPTEAKYVPLDELNKLEILQPE